MVRGRQSIAVVIVRGMAELGRGLGGTIAEGSLATIGRRVGVAGARVSVAIGDEFVGYVPRRQQARSSKGSNRFLREVCVGLLAMVSSFLFQKPGSGARRTFSGIAYF